MFLGVRCLSAWLAVSDSLNSKKWYTGDFRNTRKTLAKCYHLCQYAWGNWPEQIIRTEGVPIIAVKEISKPSLTMLPTFNSHIATCTLILSCQLSQDVTTSVHLQMLVQHRKEIHIQAGKRIYKHVIAFFPMQTNFPPSARFNTSSELFHSSSFICAFPFLHYLWRQHLYKEVTQEAYLNTAP